MDTKREVRKSKQDQECDNAIPVKMLYLNKNTFKYAIDGEDLKVSVFLDVGLHYKDQNGKEKQIPELKMRVERSYEWQNTATVGEMGARAMSGMRPITKWCTSFHHFGEDKKVILPVKYSDAVCFLEEDFKNSLFEIFGFNLKMDVLLGNQIEDIFNRACEGISLFYSQKEW